MEPKNPGRPNGAGTREADRVERIARTILGAVDPRAAGDGAVRRLLERALEAATESERRAAALDAEIARLRRLSITDEVTGALNRRGFSAAVERALARALRLGETGVLAIVDLDGFKAINDSFGHAAGDFVLRAVTSLLSASVRPSDDVARIGGDEFAVLLNGVDWREGTQRAEALEAALNGLIAPWAGRSIQVRASVGVEPYGPDDDPERLFRAADAKMYAAKHGMTVRAAA